MMTTPTLRVAPEMADALDPSGDLRRAGALDIDAVPVVEAADEWTPRTPTTAFRVWNGRLWRRETGACFFGGFQVRHVSLANERLVAEWTRGGF